MLLLAATVTGNKLRYLKVLVLHTRKSGHALYAWLAALKLNAEC